MDVTAVDPLLQAIRSGWSESLADRFERAYGQKLRWQIIVKMEKIGLLQHRVSPDRVDCLSSRRLELYENTLSDLWTRLIDGLVWHYLDRVEAGRVRQGFVAYMSGVIHHLVIENARRLRLLPDETPSELLRSICTAKGERTRQGRLAWAKYCLERSVRAELLSLCSGEWFHVVYTNVHHISDYFFEKYVIERCGDLPTMRGNLLALLLQDFCQVGGQLEQAAVYCGRVTPYAHLEATRLESMEGEGETFINALAQAADEGWR